MDTVPLSSFSHTIFSAAPAAPAASVLGVREPMPKAEAGRVGSNRPEEAAPTRAATAEVCRKKSVLDAAAPDVAAVDATPEALDAVFTRAA